MNAPETGEQEPAVTRLAELPRQAAADFLAGHGLQLLELATDADIPGTYWGAPEAGLIGNTLYARADTPVHSLLHTACHWLCMDPARRARVHTDAGGDDVEEVAVCYLQCLLADQLPGYSRQKLFADMDAWQYSFRLGSARAWFENDSEDAREWLLHRGLIRIERGEMPSPSL
jgi:hypothetical protein